PGGDVEDARTIHGYHRLFVSCPSSGIAQQGAMLETEDFPEDAVDIPGKISDSPLADLAQVNLRNLGPGSARVDHLHGEVGITRNECEGRIDERPPGSDLQPGCPMDQAARVVKPVEQRVAPLVARIRLEPEIRVSHRSFRLAAERNAEEIGESEVVATCA